VGWSIAGWLAHVGRSNAGSRAERGGMPCALPAANAHHGGAGLLASGDRSVQNNSCYSLIEYKWNDSSNGAAPRSKERSSAHAQPAGGGGVRIAPMHTCTPRGMQKGARG